MKARRECFMVWALLVRRGYYLNRRRRENGGEKPTVRRKQLTELRRYASRARLHFCVECGFDDRSGNVNSFDRRRKP